MDRQLIKLYIFIAAGLALIAAFLPMLTGKTTGLVMDVAARTMLLCAGNEKTNPPDKGKGTVIFNFDDGFESQYTQGFAILSKYDLKASVAVIPDRVGSQGYMNYQQLASMYLKGWDLLNQTYSHQDLREKDSAAQWEQIRLTGEWQDNHLMPRGKDILVFPGGYYNETTLEIMRREHFTAGRSMDSLWTSAKNAFDPEVEVCLLYPNQNDEQVRDIIDKAIEKQRTVILVLHKIENCTDQSQMQYEPRRFEELVKYIHERKTQLNILTMTEWLSASP
jgi:peptidoglycan/xylan/chitin deacetylase (PgdA/CDA1 family)